MSTQNELYRAISQRILEARAAAKRARSPLARIAESQLELELEALRDRLVAEGRAVDPAAPIEEKSPALAS